MSDNKNYSGYMPMVKQVNISSLIEMLNTNGQVIHAHSFVVSTREDNDFVFSIAEQDLVKLYFLIHKVLSNV